MASNTHRAYKMVTEYQDKDKQGNDITVTLPHPKKKLLGAGSESHCQAIADKHEGAIIEPIKGDMSQSEWL